MDKEEVVEGWEVGNVNLELVDFLESVFGGWVDVVYREFVVYYYVKIVLVSHLNFWDFTI